MDPSISVSNDPLHPPPFTAFPPFTNSNSFVAPNHPFFGDPVNPSAVAQTNNHHIFQVPPQTASAPPHPSFNHPPYSDMICTAISALNETDGSSKQAISRYIERIYTGIPSTHDALLTHHLKTLKNSGVLVMVKKSYKLAATPPATAAGIEPFRSDFTTNTVNENPPLPDLSASTTQSQKRGRGRPLKPKPDVQLSDVQTNGKHSWEQTELPVSRTEEELQAHPPIRRPPGRPRKYGSSPTVQASVSGGVEISKRRGRPPSVRAAGRERKPTVVSAPVSVFPYVANGGVRRRGRPKRVDAGVSSVAPPGPPPPPPNTEGGAAEVPVVIAKRRGRPPKIGGVIRKPLKPKLVISRTGRPRGRPRKNDASKGASGQQVGYGELKKKFELFQEKAKEIVNVLKAEIGRSENQMVVQAIEKLEELTVTTMETTNEPQHMEEVQQEEEEEEEHPETEPELERQTETEAMQEALF